MRLQLSDLVYQYNPSTTLRFPDLSLLPKEHLLVLGPSGSGKSTLLHLIAGLLLPTAGTLTIEGTDASSLRPAKRDAFRAQHISLIWQRAYFVQAISIMDNLLLAQKLAGKREDKAWISALAQRLKVDGLLHKKPAELSVGEQQRCSIIRAVLNTPSLLLADEPTSALDDENAHKVAELLLEMANESKASLVVVTHDARIKHYFQKTLTL